MRIAVICIASVLLLAGCKHQGAVSPEQQVVTKPTAPKFDLAGSWIAAPDVALSQETNEPITIREKGDGVFSVDMFASDGIAIELRTTQLGEQEDYAIADVLASSNGIPGIRYLGIIARKDDTLSVWWIESKSLARLMHADGHSAVIEYSAFGSKIFANAEDLLECIRQHSRELVGKPTTFTTKIK
ncbi:hypothetical protein [Rhodopirellula sp. MGV]|uniref:hypothetical protein n=1 Tax=Rhodopirellula sp. MGV TaxID=2023130 RepID=UPI000B96FFCC|nr:hypothetical protein [Rhodopirellula sp. MGV]OYP35627.1 hypothetical protein CGZ80_11160 [Rhodopirellula sp. MGV]PNY34036.1 hypothetical protein C2E31_25385 [Rhodopirellula baltica]PNY35645.1 hypothetical protein C2E31_17060 [Rhodopirellula baltica]